MHGLAPIPPSPRDGARSQPDGTDRNVLAPIATGCDPSLPVAMNRASLNRKAILNTLQHRFKFERGDLSARFGIHNAGCGLDDQVRIAAFMAVPMLRVSERISAKSRGKEPYEVSQKKSLASPYNV